LSPGGFLVRLKFMLSRILFLFVLVATSASAAELKFNFGDSASDKIPPGFTNLVAGKGPPGRWQVIMDATPSALAPLTAQAPSVSRRAVIGQTDMNVTDEHFPLLVYDRETFDDFTLTTKFKLVEGVSEQMAGIAFRLQDEKNFYVIRASGLGNNLRFYRVVDGVRDPPIGPALPMTKGVWRELKIECQGSRIRAWLDGQLVPWLSGTGAATELNDRTFASGKIGYWTKSDSVSYFTDTTIDYTPRVTLAQTLVRDTMEKYPRIVGLKIYWLDERGDPRVAASKDEQEVGSTGGEAEQRTISGGQVFYAKGNKTVSVVQPLRDRNGDPIAAVRVTLNSFAGQTEQSALQRALPIVKGMQARVRSLAELKQ
jgi:3-keto-disaccharide hydrolase